MDNPFLEQLKVQQQLQESNQHVVRTEGNAEMNPTRYGPFVITVLTLLRNAYFPGEGITYTQGSWRIFSENGLFVSVRVLEEVSTDRLLCRVWKTGEAGENPYANEVRAQCVANQEALTELLLVLMK